MKQLLSFVIMGIVLGEYPLPKKIRESPEKELWLEWKKLYGKQYPNEMEEMKRFDIWWETLQFVREHNLVYQLGLKTFETSLNDMADLTLEEYKDYRLGYVPRRQSSEQNESKAMQILMGNEGKKAPASWDWRRNNAVTSVKHQGSCGSCWSFAAIGVLEAQLKFTSGKLVDLSEQELVDCDYYDNGCNGGQPSTAFKYLMTHGVVSQKDYPYKAQQGYCSTKNKRVQAYVSMYAYLPSGNEDVLKQAVYSVGPIAVAIDSSPKSFKSYGPKNVGVYYEASCQSSISKLNHAVLVVGYGTDKSGRDYWIVKNSWGAKWGHGGYIYMARGRNNNCGIATDPTLAFVYKV